MEFWIGGYVQDLLIIISLIAVAAGLRRAIPPLQTLGMPDALIAGLLGVVFGPAVLDLLPFSAAHLEVVVYHALALVFIAVGLQAPPPGKRSGTARSIAFAIPAIATLQAMVGLGCVLVWNAVQGGPELHTGFGVMLPLGFNQGPGPAMTFGAAWEDKAGMSDGAQIGLIMAALGYVWCCVVGVGFVAWGRHRGWDRSTGVGETAAVMGSMPALAAELAEADTDTSQPRAPARRAKHGGLEPLTAQLVAIALVYLATWMFLELVTPVLPAQHQPTVWGFHFLIATGFALALRPVAARLPGGNPLDNDLLARTSSTIVDVATCAALAAVSVSVLGQYLAPVLLISTVGGLATLLACVWMARRAFPTRPFEHGVVAYGSLTGTATTGLALLRMLDPQLVGPAARNYVLAVPLSALLALPLLIVIQIPVGKFPADYPGAALMVLGMLFAYAVILVLAWRFLAPLRFGKTPWKLWPTDEPPA
jgi:ESS family glutamate:Na+ symporter